MSTITEINPERKAWLEARRSGIGGSDAAAILGLDPFRSPMSVWVSKVRPDLLEPEDHQWLSIGTKMEPVIDALYQEEKRIVTVKPEEIMRHPKYPEIAGNPDRLSVDRVVELKNETVHVDRYGDFGTDQVPDHVLIQVAIYMAITQKEVADIAVLHAGSRFGIYTVRRDAELERDIIERLRQWWSDYVVTKREPPIDASRDWAAYIEKKFPQNRGEIVKVPRDSEIDQDMRSISVMRTAMAESQRHLDLIENRVKKFIGDADGIEGDFGRITWRRSKDTVEDVTDWEQFANCLYEEFSIPLARFVAIRDGFTKHGVVTRQGSRRFVAKFK